VHMIHQVPSPTSLSNMITPHVSNGVRNSSSEVVTIVEM
jgi:hypothetical protein